MNEHEYKNLSEQAWRGPLSPEDEARLHAYLAEHPEAAGDWELERTLSQALTRLPDAPLASNFTALVLQAAGRSSAREEHHRWTGFAGWLARLGPRPIWAAVLLGAGLLGSHQYHLAQQDSLTKDLAKATQAAAVTQVELLQDFEAIHQLGQVPAEADLELLTAFAP